MDTLPPDLVELIAHWLVPGDLGSMALVMPLDLQHVWFKDLNCMDVEFACEYGDTNLAQYLVDRGAEYNAGNIARKAVISGDLEVFKWAMSVTKVVSELSLNRKLETAAIYGHMHIVQHVLEHIEPSLNSRTVNAILNKRHYECTKYILYNYSQFVYPHHTKPIVELGCLDLVKRLAYLIDISDALCSVNSWCVFQWLEVTFDLPKVNLSNICNLQVAQWFYLRDGCDNWGEVFLRYVSERDLDMIRWSHQSAKWGVFTNRIPKRQALVVALERGDIEIVRWVWDVCPSEITDESFHQVCSTGNVELAKWCYQVSANNYHRHMNVTMYRVCTAGHLDMIKWLHDTYKVGLPVSSYFNYDVTKVLVEYCGTKVRSFSECVNLELNCLNKVKYVYGLTKPMCISNLCGIKVETLMWLIGIGVVKYENVLYTPKNSITIRYIERRT